MTTSDHSGDERELRLDYRPQNPEHSCSGKKAFTEKRHADRAAGRRNGRGVYRCKFCHHFHVGTNPPKSAKLKRPPRELIDDDADSDSD